MRSTYFETVPIKTVEDILANELLQSNEFEGSKATVENLPYPEWQAPYLDAMLETDADKLKERICTVETVIQSRLLALSQSPNSHEERQAIDDALRGLRILKRDVLNFPDWNG